MNIDSAWLRQKERGSPIAIRALLIAHALFGRTFAAAILYGVAFYYALFASTPRTASRAYLTRVWGRANFLDVVGHIATFAICSLDRVLLAAGKHDAFAIERYGHHHLRELARTRTGALLIGAHVGSFEVLRAVSEIEGLTVNVLVHFRNARQITAMLAAVAPNSLRRVIEIDPESPHYILRVKACIEQGELVAVLGDRVGLGAGHTEVEFLGGTVRLPTGPYALAAALRCPVYLTFSLFHRPKHYTLYCEPFAARIDLPRGSRPAALQRLAQQYAHRLEFYVRHAPDCWFNFFSLWS